MHTPNDKKRIVSKARYLGILSGRLMLGTTSAVLFYGGIVGMLCTGFFTFALMIILFQASDRLGDEPKLILFGFLFLGVTFVFSAVFAILGRAGMKSLQKAETVVPLTRQTALEIPAEESLVRASCADTLAEESVLLRPAETQTDTASEELLRPHININLEIRRTE